MSKIIGGTTATPINTYTKKQMAGVIEDKIAETTPKKGIDYWTEADIAEIKSYVEEAILGGEW